MEENKDNLENIEELSEVEQVEEIQPVDNLEQETVQENIQKEVQEKVQEEIFDDEHNQPEEDHLISVRPVKFQEFEKTPPIRTIKKNLDILQDIMMHVSVELGRTKSSIREVMDLEQGTIVELDKIAGEQVEIFVNDKLVAKGEVIVIEDKFGVRVTSTNLPKNDY